VERKDGQVTLFAKQGGKKGIFHHSNNRKDVQSSQVGKQNMCNMGGGKQKKTGIWGCLATNGGAAYKEKGVTPEPSY